LVGFIYSIINFLLYVSILFQKQIITFKRCGRYDSGNMDYLGTETWSYRMKN